MPFKLTERGERAAETVKDGGGARADIINYMYLAGADKAMELEELQDYAKLSDEATVKVLTSLQADGYIVEV